MWVKNSNKFFLLRNIHPLKQNGSKHGQRRNLSLHEYQSMELLEKNSVPVPKGIIAHSPSEASKAFETLSVKSAVAKAQVLAGGRGRGHFTSGLKGGVQMIDSADNAKSIVADMIGHKLITKQTGDEGKPCNSVFIVEKLNVKKEFYFAITLDRVSSHIAIIASNRGGVNIEDVAAESPEAIHKVFVDGKVGLKHEVSLKLASDLGFGPNSEEAAKVFENLYAIFNKTDSTMIEINPLALVTNPENNDVVVCMDAKFSFDDNASFRQKEIFALKDYTQEDPLEARAEKAGLNYIKLDGNISCMVNGAGLAMATMDVIKYYGGSPSNFLDIGGTAESQQIIEAFELLSSDSNTKVIFVNVFGGIIKCDVVAAGIIEAAKKIDLKLPLVVRFMGTNVKKASELIKDSGLKIDFFNDLGTAAKHAVSILNN